MLKPIACSNNLQRQIEAKKKFIIVKTINTFNKEQKNKEKNIFYCTVQ